MDGTMQGGLEKVVQFSIENPILANQSQLSQAFLLKPRQI